MKKFFLLPVFLLASVADFGQCMVSTLVINTGYDPSTGFAITPGTNGGTAVPDPHWIVTTETPSIATAIALTGLTEVTIGAPADIITQVGAWATNPALNFGGWISCLNSNTYNTDGTGPTGTQYNMTLGRPFRMCVDDSITLDFYIANDNWMSTTDIDGVPLSFTQPAIDNASNFEVFSHFTQTVYLTAGTHTFHAVVNNYNDNSVESNPTGMNIYGTVSSSTGINSLVYEGDPACGTYVCGFVPSICNSLSMPDSLNKCRGDSAIIPAVITGTDSVLSLLWTPSGGLSDTAIADPTYHYGITSGYRYLIMESLNPTNLVVNGNFTYGNSGFNSAYPYVTGSGSLVPAGVYTITTDPHLEHTGAASFGDHTTGTGGMMAMNGASTPIDVWCQTIDVTPNTNYFYSAWFANWSSDTSDNLPIIQFKINGIVVGDTLNFPHADGVWTQFADTWNSGTSTTATICIYDQQTASDGNDFAIDDIYFEPVCVDTDSIYLKSINPDTVVLTFDTTICAAIGAINLNAAAGFVTYQWSTGSVTDFISVSATGTYSVVCVNLCNVEVETFNVNVVPSPLVFLGDDTSFCQGDSLTLTSVQPPSNTYLWSNGTTGTTMTVNTGGTYWVTVTIPPGCVTTDSIHVMVPLIPQVNLGSDIFDCGVGPIVMQSSITYPASTYLWSDGTIFATDTAHVTGTYWLQVTDTGCSNADTVNITIMFDTLTLYSPDTAICLGNSVHVAATANPAISCQWIPTAGIAISNVLAPTITPDTSAMYVLTGILPGCPNIVDSFFIDVEPNPHVVLAGGRQVCQYDSLQLPVWVTPGWYPHYSFTWSIVPSGTLDTTTAWEAVFIGGVSSQVNVTVSTPAGCAESDSAQIIVRPGGFAGGDTSVTLCPGDSIRLAPSGGVAYRWHPGTYLSDSAIQSPLIHAINNITYNVVATSNYGCLDTVNIALHVLPAAVMLLNDSATIYPGESYQITAQTNCAYFSWFPPNGLSSSIAPNPLASPIASTNYVVTATTEAGCLVMDSLLINVDDGMLLSVPNAFTPGGNENNLLSIIYRGEAALHYFRVYDRWGVLVFETDNLNAGWDGRFKGQPQPQGVYIYEIEALANDGVVFHKQGNVTLLR